MAIPPISANSLPMLAPHSIEGGTPLVGASGALRQGERLEEPSAFQKLFEETVGKTNTSLVEAEAKAKAFATGQSDDIHGTMIASSQADIQLRLLGSMRNKIVDAFNELWRMQI